jgi:hypothetical protein
MIKLYSPENEIQLSILRSIFEAEGIPIFVHNDHFGSMRTGMQIELLNRRTIMVSKEFLEQASEVMREYLKNLEPDAQEIEPVSEGYSVFDKVRMIFEGLVFGWVMPGKKWRKE